MADLGKMDRTWLCSVLFMDIANYSSQSVELQMKWKTRFNGYLSDAIREVPESERVILDTGDGAAVCFLGAPEAAMFAALELCRSFTIDDRDQKPGLRVRLGINLGPVKLVRDINGALNAIGDGINAGQRIMSFASDNQILVSQSFYEVVSRLSEDYKLLFHLKGVETDKHVREHTVYHLTPPGSAREEPTIPKRPEPMIAVAPSAVAPPEHAQKNRWLPWLIAGTAVAALAGVSLLHFNGSAAPPASTAPVATAPVAAAPQSQTAAPNPQPAVTTAPAAQAVPAASKPSAAPPATSAQADARAANEPDTGKSTPGRRGRAGGRAGAIASAPPPPPSPEAKAAYDSGTVLIDQQKPADAAHKFDDAIRAQPDYIDGYLGRAEARRQLLQFDLSLQDCSKVIQINAGDPRGYNCRGLGHQMLKQLTGAVSDFDEALRLNPNFIIAYEHRGTVYDLLQQYDRAVQDYSRAISLAPRNPVFWERRGAAYNNLKQYDKAIRDLTQTIRLQPNRSNAYRLRAVAEEASGDAAGAAADRSHVKDTPKKKNKEQPL